MFCGVYPMIKENPKVPLFRDYPNICTKCLIECNDTCQNCGDKFKNTKKQVVEKWKKIAETSQYLWKNQAQINASVIKKNSTKRALVILKKDYEKYGEMGIGSYIQSAISDLEELSK
jgi:hypothetical protein